MKSNGTAVSAKVNTKLSMKIKQPKDLWSTLEVSTKSVFDKLEPVGLESRGVCCRNVFDETNDADNEEGLEAELHEADLDEEAKDVEPLLVRGKETTEACDWRITPHACGDGGNQPCGLTDG